MKPNFSKLILALVMGAYFVAVIIGSIAVILDTTQSQFYFLFIAAPTATALGFYSWKAKSENVVKIQRGKGKGNEE
jgi:hypothetical protein